MTNKPNFYQLYQEVGNIQGELKKMSEKLDAVCINHDTRINSLEKQVDTMVGKASVFATIFGFIGGIVTVIFSSSLKK